MPLPSDSRASDESAHLLDAVRQGDEAALDRLVDLHHMSLLRFVAGFVPQPEARDEIVQTTWAAALDALDGFAGRASFRTWLFTIALNTVRAAARRDARTIPFASLAPEDPEAPALSPDAFLPDGHWARPIRPWEQSPEKRYELAELRRIVDRALETLPPNQRAVLVMRDVEGMASDEVCAVLGLTDANQRVLLHRARSRVRAVLAEQLARGEHP